MHIGLVIGKKNSTGVPGKNTRPILGRPCAEYAFIAAKHSIIERLYVSTDCPVIQSIGNKYEATIIERPAEHARPDSLTEDTLVHAYEAIKQDVKKISTVSLLICNNPAINVNLLNEAISFLEKDETYDSCFSVVRYDMFSPARARKLSSEGEILPFAKVDEKTVSSLRGSSGGVYFCDMSIQVMKPRCFESMDQGNLPFKWQGKKSKAVETDFGFDVDSEWQFVVLEYWLKKHGFTETAVPWER